MNIAQLEKEIKNYHNGKEILFYISVLTLDKTLENLCLRVLTKIESNLFFVYRYYKQKNGTNTNRRAN